MTTPTATPAVTALPQFLAAVKASGVLTGAELSHAAAAVPADATAADAARRFVEAGALTRFQADRLLTGKPHGLVIGQYVLLEPVGSGPSGRVFLVRHRTMGRKAAIKVLSAALAAKPEAREAFKAEARAAAKLAHPHVVTVMDVHSLGDRPYLIREFVDGPTALAAVRQFGPMAVPTACEVVRQAALGLQHAHEKGVCHGAVTPGNLLVGRDGRRPAVKVANFGMGRLGGPAANGADPADYTAPEQAAGHPPTPAADLYALGCTLFFLLTGEPAFRGPRQPSEPAPEVELFNPHVPAGVAAVLRGLLAASPAERPASAAAVAERLAPFADHGGTAVVAPVPSGWVAVPVVPPPCPFAEMVADAHTPEATAVPTPLSTRHPQRRR